MTDLNDQEREALRAALYALQWIADHPEAPFATAVHQTAKKGAEDARAALAAREEPQGDVIQRVKAILDYGDEQHDEKFVAMVIRAAREEPAAGVVDLIRRVLPFLMDYREPAGEEPPFGCGEAEEMAVKRDLESFLAAREDTERPDEICGVSCAAGPNGEPLACGYESGHDGSHSWASLPTWTGRWRIVHQPHRDPKKSSLAIEGPPCGSQVVYGVAMDRGVPAHERAVRDTEQEHEQEQEPHEKADPLERELHGDV